MKRSAPSVKTKASPGLLGNGERFSGEGLPARAGDLLAPDLLSDCHMQGVITERHFDIAERLFPGIRGFYDLLSNKPSTFLELVWAYEHQVERSSCRTRRRVARTARRPPR